VAVTHDGALSGDELFLLYFLRWLTSTTDVDTEVLTWHEGTLTDDLRAVTSVRAVAELDRWRPARIFEVLRIQRAAQVLKGLRLRWWLHRRRHADVLYLNGLEAARIVGYLWREHPSVVVHVHDLAELDSPRLTDADRQAIAATADLVVCAADEVADAVHERLGVPRERIRRHDHFVAGVDQLPASTVPPTRADLGFGPDDLVVGGIGTDDWWAAADQFALVAWALTRRDPDRPFRFLWIAGDDDPRILWPLHHDLANAGVAERTVVGTGRRPLDYLGLLDVLVLATRVEAQELVALEAAAADVLVVATDNLARTGALGELATVVPYLDTQALVDATLALLDDPAARAAQAGAARAVALRHHDVGVGGAMLLAMLGDIP